MLAMGPRDLNSAPYSPVHYSSHSMTSFQSSELTELPVVENGQLFAQRAHSARYAPLCTHDPPCAFCRRWCNIPDSCGSSPHLGIRRQRIYTRRSPALSIRNLAPEGEGVTAMLHKDKTCAQPFGQPTAGPWERAEPQKVV